MLPTGYLPTSLPLHLPLEPTHCVVGDARAPSSEVPFMPRLAYHGLFHIPKVYRTLAATAVPSCPPAAQEGSGPREASAMPTLTKTKQYTTALAAALWQSRDGDIPNLSAFLLGGPEPYGEEQDDEREFVNPFSAASAPTWATNGRGKSLTARDPLLLLEWLEAVNATVNGVGTEGFDPEAMWEFKQGDSSATPSSSPSSSSCHHFASATEARAAKDTAKAALDVARKRLLLTRRSWSHFTLSATKGVATVAQILEILGSSAGDVAVAAMGGGYGGSSGDETYYCGNAPATSGIPVALRSAAASELAVIEAALVVLYNIMHPVSTLEATKVPMVMKTSAQVHHRAEAEGDNDDNANYEPQGTAPPMCLTHVSAGSQGQWKTVRSEISKLRNAPPAPLVPTHKAGHSSLAASSFGPSTHRIITVDSFYIKRERSLPTVQKLMKLNIYRPLMALLTRHCAAASAAPSNPDGAAPSPPTSVLSSPHSQIVYYCCLVLSAIGGGTKVYEDGLVSARLTKSIRMLPLFGGTKAVTGSEPGGGDEGSDSEGEDEGDDEDGKKGKKSKSKSDAEAFNGGTSSGPLKLAGVAGLAKTATIARLGGGAAALMTMAGLVTSAITNQMAMGTFGGPRSSEVVSRAHHHWPQYFGSSWVVFGHQQSSVAPLTFLSALFSALCTMAAGPANITFLHKRGALDVVGSVLEALAMPMSVRAQQNIPGSSTDFGSLLRLQQKACCLRWALEFLYRSLNPSPSRIGGGVMNVQLPPEELTLLKDIFIKDHRGIPALMATAAIGALGAGDTGPGVAKALPFPSIPLFCASCDVLHLVLSVPTVTAMARSVDGGLNPLVACVAESAAADSRLAALLSSAAHPTLQVAACYRVLRPSPASWALLILFLQRALDIKELPVGTDNELAWFPPPELVEQLKKQQLLAAENSSKQAEGEGEGEEEEENDQANDEDDEEAEEDGDFVDDDIAAAAMGLGDYSPELQYRSLASDQAPSASAAPLIPSHTSILGIASVHHIKPFSADRPVPSSTAVINNSPSAIEPLLLQAETQRSEVVKGQLRRLLFGPEYVKATRVAFDDLARAEQMPKTRLSSILGEAPKGVGCDLNSNCGPDAPTWAEPPRTITARLALDAASAPLPLLSFDSSFESGNLKRAIHVMDNEYDLILHTDVNTNSFVQWFYFSVKGMVPNTKYRFNILNMEKESSTFNDGQRPLLFSEKRFEQSSKRVAWVREGEDIAYYKNSLARRVRERYVPLELMAISGRKGKGDTDELLNEESATGKKGQKGASSKATTPKSPAPVAKGKGLSIGSKRRSESGSGVSSQQTQGAKVPAKDPKPKKVKKAASNTSTYYTLSFTITFPHANDRVYLSNCYPYTYSDLVGYCRRLITGHEEACAAKGQSQQGDKAKAPQVPPHCLFVQSLCPTLSGNATPLLTITNLRRKDGITIVPEEDLRRRPVVLLTARVHPGESNASYMIKGCADFLLNPNNIVAAQLRDQFVFKIIPMLNPDGVINGNHRCGLAGTDLNRGYHKPSRWRNPTIFYLKALVYHIKRIEGRSVLLYSDFHGHSRCHNSVIYGCGEENTMKSIFEGLAIAANSPTMPTSPLFGAEVGSSFSQASEPTQGGASTSKKKTGKKTAETVAESFGFSESSKPHPFTLPYNTNLSMSYGPPERLLPLLLSQLCPYFSFGSSTFTVQKGKRNTGRVVFYRQMGIRMSYTIEASMMGGFGCDFAMASAATCDEFPSKIIGHQHQQDPTMAIAAYAISKSPMDAEAFKRLSAEQQQRLAAQWAIQHDQLSGLQRPDPTGVGASDGKPPTSAAGHFSPKHYCTIGIMFLKALHFMYSYSNPQLGMTPKVPQHGNEDDPYYSNREADDGKTLTSNLPIEPQIAAAVDGLPPSIGTSMAVLRRAALEAADKRRKARAVKKTKTKKPKGASAGKSKGNTATSTGPGGAKPSNPRTPSTASEVQPQSAKALPPKAGKVSNTTSPQIGPMSAGVISFDSSARAQRSSAPLQKPVAGGSRVPGIRSGSGGALYSSGQRGLGASPAVSQGKKVVAGGLPPQRPATQQATMSSKHVDLHGGTPLALIARTSPSPSPPPPMVFSGTYANATRKGSMVPSSVRDDGEGQLAGLGGIEEKEGRSENHQEYPEEDDTASDSADENNEEEEDEEEEDNTENMPDPEDDEYDLGDECPAPLDCPAQVLDSATGKPSVSTTAPKPPQPKAKNRAKPLQHPAPLDILGFCRQAFAQGPVLI